MVEHTDLRYVVKISFSRFLFFFFFDNTGHSFFSKMCMNPFKGDLIEKRLRK